MLSTQKCLSWRGHKFEARYSTEPCAAGHVKLENASEDLIRDLWVKRTYEGDICVRCGVRIDRTRAVGGVTK